MEIISVGNRKGGTAKSTSALNIAAGLQRSGRRVLLIDMDSQCCLSSHLGIDPENTHTVYDILTGQITAKEAIVSTGEELDLIPASPELSDIERREISREEQTALKEALKPIRKAYDFIIIDTAPALGNLLITALTASKSVLITAEARQYSLEAIIQINGIINAVRQHTNRKLQIEGILITRCKPRTILTKDMRLNLEDLAQYLHTKVFKTMIRDCSAIGEAESMHKTIYRYAPRSNGAKDYTDLVKEILQEGGA